MYISELGCVIQSVIMQGELDLVYFYNFFKFKNELVFYDMLCFEKCKKDWVFGKFVCFVIQVKGKWKDYQGIGLVYELI